MTMAAPFKHQVRGGRDGGNAPMTLSPFPSLLELYERALFYEGADAPVRVANDGTGTRLDLLGGTAHASSRDHLQNVIQEVLQIFNDIQDENERGNKEEK